MALVISHCTAQRLYFDIKEGSYYSDKSVYAILFHLLMAHF